MFKNNAILTVTLLLTAFYSVSQVQVIQRPANTFQFATEDIWNIDLVSPYSQSFQAKARAFIKSSDGKTIVEMQSTNFTINSGYNNLSPTVLATTRKNYFNRDIQEIEEITGSLPAGSYKLCIQFSCVKPDCDGLNEVPFGYETYECIDLVLIPATPLLLAYPEDEAKLNISRPSLTWIPPMPIAMSSNLTYTLSLTEMRKGQSKMDAVKRNRPLIYQDNISSTTLPYPMDMEELEKGKHYSWQVEAWVGRTKVGTSEVWEFEIEEEEKKEEKEVFNYVTIKSNDLDVYFIKDKLRFLYIEQYIAGKLDYQIHDPKGRNVTPDKELHTQKGENRYEIDIKKELYKSNTIYTLMIYSRKGEKFQLKFQII